MKKKYQIRAWVKGDRGGLAVTVILDTITEVTEWIAEHRAENNSAHAYQVLTRYNIEGEIQLATGYYFVDGQEIDERQFIEIMYARSGLKS